MTQPPTFIPGRIPPRRRVYPAVWAVLGAVVALAAAGGVWLVFKPAANTGPDRQAQVVSMCENSANDQVKSPASTRFSDVKVAAAGSAAWTVYGNMDTANGFGALIRTHFRCSVALGAGNQLYVTESSVDEP